MEGCRLLVAVVVMCLISIEATPAKSALHSQLRRALSRRQAIDIAACNDNSQCNDVPDVCNSDPEIATTLCPYKCGACVCADSITTQGNCSENTPAICEGEFAKTLCPKTCGICGNSGSACFDHVTGISCADLPDPCSDDLGKIACPKYCGFCSDSTVAPPTNPSTTATTTPATTQTVPIDACATSPCLNGGVCTQDTSALGFTCQCTTQFMGSVCQTKVDVCMTSPCLNSGVCSTDSSMTTGYKCTCVKPYSGSVCQIKDVTTTQATTTTAGGQTTSAPSGSCSNLLDNQSQIACVEGEVIFLVEYGYKDTGDSIDHEGDFIKELVDAWNLKSSGIRFGVVLYHDTVREAIHITDFPNDPDGLKDRITRLTRDLRPSGSADLGKALDYVRTNSFKNARPGVTKTVIPIIHQMSSRTKDNILPASTRLKDDCVSIAGIAVRDSSIDYDILHKTVSQPYNNFYSSYRSFNDLENAGKWIHYFYSGCRASTRQ